MFPSILATILFSFSVICATRTTRMLGGTTANLLRLVLAALLLAAWAHGFGQGIGGGGLFWFFLSGVIGFGMGDLALYMALPRIGPRLTALLMQCLAAPLAAVAEWLWLGTTLTPGQLVSGGVILVGVGLAVAPREHLHLKRSVLVLGIVFGVVAAMGQGWGAVLSRKAYLVVEASGGQVDGLTATYQRILGGLIFAVMPALWLLRRHRLLSGAGVPGRAPLFGRGGGVAKVWGWILFNALSGPSLGVACYQWALATTPSGVVLPIVATMPIVVMPLAYVIEGDRPTGRALIGGLIAVIGVIGMTLS